MSRRPRTLTPERASVSPADRVLVSLMASLPRLSRTWTRPSPATRAPGAQGAAQPRTPRTVSALE